MNDPIEAKDEARFAAELERELESLENKSGLSDDHRVADSDARIDRRLKKAKPVLDLLLQLKDCPDLVVANVATETGDAVDDITCPSAQLNLLPNLNRLGRFKIEREIGRGGNGIVLQAEDQKLERTVAIKVPRLSVALAGETRARFEREAKAVASLNHPGIVAIHEVGHDQGVDYIVSQFVDGVSLADWVEQESVTPRQAAACVLFLADAMQHAHERGVLHRDLKPSNVIVESSWQDTIGFSQRCRIVDFGLAAIKDDSAHDLTRGAMIGTPAYMSPEQTRGSGDAIGTQTDVYGLGVILYQLLTGQPPFAGDDLIQLIEKVRHQDPQISTKSFPPDLIAITLKCLEKRSDDRYQAAADLRDDLERFLNNETVVARPATVANKIKKWVQRNPLIAAMIATLLVAVSMTSYAAIRATVAEKKSRHAEELARVEAGTANEVSLFLEDMFQVPKVLASRQDKLHGKDVTAEQILKHAAGQIHDNLNSQPKVKARLMTIIGSSLAEIGNFIEAEDLLRSGLELNLANLVSNDLDLAKSHQQLGKLLRRLDQKSEAESHLLSAIEILENDVAQNHKRLATCYNDLGVLLRPTDPQSARKAYRQARDLVEIYQPNKRDTWTLSANIANLDYLSGHYENAARAFEKALDSAIASHGVDHPKVAMLQGNISKVYMKLGEYEKAKQYRLRDLAVSEQAFGVDHFEVGIALIGLAEIHRSLGELDAAVQSGERAIQILAAAMSPGHQTVLRAINQHIITLIRTGGFQDAERLGKALEDGDKLRLGDAVDYQMLKNQLLISQVERYNRQYDSAMSRIDFVVNHELAERNKAIGTDARLAQALLLAETGDETAESAIKNALAYAAAANVLAEPDLAYIEAQFRAVAGQSERALKKLAEAIEGGYKNARVLNDPDFRNLAKSATFKNIVGQLQRD